MNNNFKERTTDLTPKMQDQSTHKDVLEKQLELLLRTSEYCERDDRLIQHIPTLTHAMIEISQILCTAD